MFHANRFVRRRLPPIGGTAISPAYNRTILSGHAFRSLTVHILQNYGDQGVTYAEEVSPYDEFPGQHFHHS